MSCLVTLFILISLSGLQPNSSEFGPTGNSHEFRRFLAPVWRTDACEIDRQGIPKELCKDCVIKLPQWACFRGIETCFEVIVNGVPS
jgi:hypothetical protein